MTDHAKTETISIAPVIRDAAHAARIEEAARGLEVARNGVCDAALEWDDAQEGDECERDEASARLAEAMKGWRTATDAFLRAMSGRS